MARIANLMGMSLDPATVWIALQEKAHHVLDLVKSHPWTSVGVTTGTALLWSYVRTPRNLPPGPSGLPFIGALSGFSEDLPQKLLAWREKYGDVISFYRMGRIHVILNDEKPIREAFTKHGDVFGHRANLEEIHFRGFHDDIFAGVFDKDWAKNKRFTVSTLKQYGFGTAPLEAKIHEELQKFEEALLASDGRPIDISEDINKLFAAIIWSIILDGSKAWDDLDLHKTAKLTVLWFEIASKLVTALGMFHFILHPKLASFVLRRTKLQLRHVRATLYDLIVSKIKAASLDTSDQEPQCVLDAFLREHGSSPKAVHDITNNIMGLLPDPIEVSARACEWAILYLASEPDLVEKLHAEIISVCGPNQVPNLADHSQLPLHQAVMHEVLRFSLLRPLSHPRILHQDFTLNSFTLPKGSIIEANYYGLHFDADVFPDPSRFHPFRFLKSDGKFNTDLGAKLVTFSIGNRMCIGKTYFKVKFFFFLTRLTQRFQLKFDPAAPEPCVEKTVSFLNEPPRFKVCFQPR